MAEKVPHFREQFCKSIEFAAERNTGELLTSLRNGIQLYDVTEISGYIHLKRNEVRQILEGSDFKTYFPVNGIETNLTTCLERYCNENLIQPGTGEEYRKSIKSGRRLLNIIIRILTTDTIPWFHTKKTPYSFIRLQEFSPVIEYIAHGRLFLELNRLDVLYRRSQTGSGGKSQWETTPHMEPSGADLQKGNGSMTSGTNSYSQVFKEGAFDLFAYLNSEYSKDDQKPVAKYSNIYHFLKYEQMLLCTQREYIQFMESEMQVGMSKILPENYKYLETILPLLGWLKSDFEKRIKKEQK